MLNSLKNRNAALVSVAGILAFAVAILGLPNATASHGAVRHTASVQGKETVAKTNKGKVIGYVRGDFGKKGVVRGYFVPDRFYAKKGKTYADGILHAKLMKSGDVVGHAKRHVTLLVSSAKNPKTLATCDILHLVLGPLDLNLLGVKVHLDKVVLDIVAQSGAGNLLGNLLCAVTGLLDANQLKLANVLNRILALLRPVVTQRKMGRHVVFGPRAFPYFSISRD
jgi:hypothetical protein